MAKAAEKKIVLTDRALKALKPAPEGKRYWVWDAHTPHLGIRVTDKGHRAFVVVKRTPGDKQPMARALGTYPALKLKDARDRVPAALAAINVGKDPKEAEREAAREEARKRQDTFSIVAEEFLTRYVPRLRTEKEVSALVRRELIGRWGDRPAADIKRRDVIEMLDEMVEANGRYAARHALAHTRKLFNWALQRDVHGLEVNPCSGIVASDQIGEATIRQRRLNDDELCWLWHAADHVGDPKRPPDVPGYPFGAVVRMILLTGQRRDEIAHMRWSEVKDRVLTVPAERMKGKKAHRVPLTASAETLLKTVPKFKKGEFVFSTTSGKRPVSGFSKAKARIDVAMAVLAREAGHRKAIPHWTLHDLRRTVRTGLSSLGVPLDIAEMLIGHARPQLIDTYDLYGFDDEKRGALEKWEKHLLNLVTPSPADATGKVVKLRGARR